MTTYSPPKTLPAEFDRAQELAAKAITYGGILSLVALVTGGGVTRYLQTYLVGYLYWVGISMACLGLLLLHQLVGGIWGFLVRRAVQAGVWVLPRMALLFLPIAFAVFFRFDVYTWAVRDHLAHDHHLHEKVGYLNPLFFLFRSALYFGIWIATATLLERGMRAQDETSDPAPTRWLQKISGPGLALFFLSMTFAFMDWGMSLEPKWYSTIYGVMLLMGAGLATLSILVNVASALKDIEPFKKVATPQAFHDLGNLMLAFTMLWAYTSFSQYLVTYSGNTTEEIPFYLHRSTGGWRTTAIVLIFFQFFLPFFLLLSRDRKRNAESLAKVGRWILVMHFVDLVWLVIPAFRPWNTFQFFNIIATISGVLGAFLLIGGFWVSAFLGELRSRPLLPGPNDPLLLEVFEHQHAGHEGGH